MIETISTKLKNIQKNNPQAGKILLNIITTVDDMNYYIEKLEKFDLVGDKLVKFYNMCCNGDKDKFKRTIILLSHGVYTKEEIDQNMMLDNPIPFISDDIKIDINNEFNYKNENWYDFCMANKECFNNKNKTR